jgi:uncharacterized membrane-anchored protein
MKVLFLRPFPPRPGRATQPCERCNYAAVSPREGGELVAKVQARPAASKAQQQAAELARELAALPEHLRAALADFLRPDDRARAGPASWRRDLRAVPCACPEGPLSWAAAPGKPHKRREVEAITVEERLEKLERGLERAQEVVRSRTQEASFSHKGRRSGCPAGTLRLSRHQSFSTRLWFTVQPSRRSSAVIRR